MGKRVGGGRLNAIVLKKEVGDFRAAYIVGKKHGIAVARNRIKRVLREAFRKAREGCEGAADIVFIPKEGGGASLSEGLDEIKKILKNAGFSSRE